MRREGAFMLGQVATLRHEVTTIGDLHGEVTDGASDLLAGPDLATGGATPGAPARPDRLDIAIVGMAGCAGVGIGRPVPRSG